MFTYIAFISLAISLTSIVIVIILYRDIYQAVNNLIDELGIALIARKKYRRIKRYILAKVICRDNVDIRKLSEDVERSVNSLLGRILKMNCSLTIISFRPDLNRAIFRVVGDGMCSKYCLLALSLQHFISESCIIIPLKTSGLLSRLRKFTSYRK
jgi:RNase P/RNase MRP subunit POP5